MRQIERAAQVLAKLLRGESVKSDEIDQALREVGGMDLPTLDALPREALLALLVPGDDRSAERLKLLARLLLASAIGPLAEQRRAKAIFLLEQLGEDVRA